MTVLSIINSRKQLTT